MKKNQFLTIHGHFYQPPRENPWIEEIEREDSAAPDHDWNERIASQCYTPNAASRILDHLGRIEDIVNNYQRISFNFGPTLLNWLQKKIPETYRAIIAADRNSVETFSGHGNAIAQAYNHIILPLANYRDKVTQIKWGLADFQYRFHRQSEAIWLPETAIDYATLKILIDLSIKFIILSPYQAKRVRKLGGNESENWQDVGEGSIDVTRPYRCFLSDPSGKKQTEKFIDIFFYHGGLSRSVGFEHVLRDAKEFANHIQKTYHPHHDQNQLISVCTDGESYGHHEPFGDMALAYLMFVEAKKRNLHITNYGEFLELNPPQWEVELKEGPNAEGTSWSCYHGVGRWYRDCGCNAGGPAGWNQKWRSPLRKALDDLRDDLIRLYEEVGSKYFKDAWEARNDYIQVILQRDEKTIQNFLEKHSRHASIANHKIAALNLLELQRNAMLMYTSCGWFFNDISGIETIQILRYAACAMELARYFGNDELETKFLDRLQAAKSNIPKLKDGATIYKMHVRPSMVTFPKVVNHFAVLSSLKEPQTARSIYHFSIEPCDKEDLLIQSKKFTIARIQVTSGITFESAHYAYLLANVGELNYACYVKPLKIETDYDRLKSELKKLAGGRKSHFQKHIQDHWREGKFSFQDTLYDERLKLFHLFFHDKMEQLHQVYRKIYEDNKIVLDMMVKMDIPIPDELKIPAETTLSIDLFADVEKSKHDFDKAFYKNALAIVEKADAFGFELNVAAIESIVDQILLDRIERLYQQPQLQDCTEFLEILQIMNNLKFKINQSTLQNVMFNILKEKLPRLIDEIVTTNALDERFQLVTGLIQLAYHLNFAASLYKEKLHTIEKKLSDDPRFWP